MERLLDSYLLENGNSFGFDNGIVLKDIDVRRLTTFISRIQNALDFNSKVGNREKNSRYVLAQLYQSELMKNTPIQAKNKLVNFINCIRNNDFEGMQIEKNNQLQRENIINSAILEGENLLKKIYQKISDIEVVDINSIDLNNSYFHFTMRDNFSKINNEGLKLK